MERQRQTRATFEKNGQTTFERIYEYIYTTLLYQGLVQFNHIDELLPCKEDCKEARHEKVPR